MHRSNSVLAVKTGPKTKNILLDAGPKSGALGIWGPCAVAQPAQAPGRPCQTPHATNAVVLLWPLLSAISRS